MAGRDTLAPGGEIRSWFVIRNQPFGAAPDEIKDQWIGVPLPLRYDRSQEAPITTMTADVNEVGPIGLYVVPDAIEVRTIDAIKALKLFDRSEAAKWWDDWSINRHGGYFSLTFQAREGDLVPPDYLRMLLPGIESFDSMEA